MEQRKFTIQSIGIIHTQHTDPLQTPIQPVFSKGMRGQVTLFLDYVDGLADLDGFSHIYLFYYFDRSTMTKMRVKPYLDDKARGIFATRAPHRPNKIGMSLVRLLAVRDNVLEIDGADMLDKTPLIDIKPYIDRFDPKEAVRSGWQDQISDDVASLRGTRKFKTQE
jgi:tRNA-Thr(GGU) m(6)t(6)A37 methyltransferase TsaA